ncbi:MAG TPA: NAD(P)H-hydrate dehydratase [Candidatus Kapabacteria bacterium]|nr:NAD(P)H-hydrate dehydratase [Candidatus Kapabacteria bacterium]
MLPVLSSAESHAYDDFLIKKIGFDPLVLMENAARGALAAMKDWLATADGKSILIFCGKGNNGGDGLALARLLLEQDRDALVVLTAKPTELSKESAAEYKILKKIIDPDNIFQFPFQDDHFLSHLDVGVIVDALLGSGASGRLKKPYDDAVLTINGLAKAINAKVLSLDVPTGLHSDTGAIETMIKEKPVCVFADRTIAMGTLKTGFFQGFAPDVTGELAVAPLGAPTPTEVTVNVIERSDIAALLPVRFKTASKFDEGHVLSIAGSRGMTGAAAMSAQAALRSGCGLVTVATAASERSIVASSMPELMTIPLSDQDGNPTFAAFKELEPLIERADVILLGPGIRNTKESNRLMKEIFLKAKKPMVCDAGALSMIAEDTSMLKKRSKDMPTILTPHAGEMARLLGITRDKLEKDRIALALDFAKEYSVFLVLKGAPTLVVSPEDEGAYINSTGNPGMATAGSGDVLAGMIAGNLAQDTASILHGLIFSVYTHGLAGDIAANELTMSYMTATDIIKYLPKAFKELAVE